MSGDPRRRGPTIDLNADVGEGFDDAALIPLVTSVNVACGGHAGDDATMRATVRLARTHGVALGAHPGFPDRADFGRRVTTADPDAIASLIVEQVERLAAIARDEGVPVAHVKPHGALYNLSAVDRAVAQAVARAVVRVLPGTRLVGLAGSISLDAARAAGLTPVAEAFADRAYLADGTLAPRARAGAVIENVDHAASRAVELVTTGTLEAIDGAPLRIAADTLCLHGDTPDAALRARTIRTALAAASVTIARLAAP